MCTFVHNQNNYLHLTHKKEMEKKIDVKLLPEAESYFESLPYKTKIKFLKIFSKIQILLKSENFKKLAGTEIWEFWYNAGSKFYRILAFWDADEETTTIVCTHGFDKKKNKTPSNEIKKAEAIKKTYKPIKTKNDETKKNKAKK
jgi:phage-related protein